MTTRPFMSRLRLIGGIALAVLLVLALLVAGFKVKGWLDRRASGSPEMAIESYFQALADGDYGTMYNLTLREELTDVFGRKLTRDEFLDQVQKVTGGQRMTLEKVESAYIGRQGEYRFYQVTLYYNLGGEGKVKRLLVAVKKEYDAWRIAYPFTPQL